MTVGDHVGSDDGKIEILGVMEGLIDKLGNDDTVGLLEGMMDDDGDSDGVNDDNSDGWMLGSLETLMNVQFWLSAPLQVLIVIAPNPFSSKQ